MTPNLVIRPNELKKLKEAIAAFKNEGFMVTVSVASRIIEGQGNALTLRDKNGSLVFTVTHIASNERIGDLVLDTNRFHVDDTSRRTASAPITRPINIIPTKIRFLIDNYKIQKEILTGLE